MTKQENEFPPIEMSGDESSLPKAEIASLTAFAEASESSPEPVVPVEEIPPEVSEPEEGAPKDESKARRFFRMLLRWTLGLLIVFGVGFLTAVYMLYRPEVQLNRELQNQLQSQQQAAEQQVAELESQIGELEAQVDDLSPLAAENEELLAAQVEFEVHISILDARMDVSNALLALAMDDPAKARVSLDRTGETLANLSSLLPADQRGMVTSMEQRLELALTEIEADPYAAKSDLDVLAKSLLELEDSLFGSL